MIFYGVAFEKIASRRSPSGASEGRFFGGELSICLVAPFERRARALRTSGRRRIGFVGVDAHKGKGNGSATIWTHVERHDFIHVAVTGAPALQLHHLLEFESLYGELICQAFEKCALLRVARSPAHKGQIRGIRTEFVQFFR